MYKKLIIYIFLIISILVLNGCGASQSPNADLSGVHYKYYTEYTYNNETYIIYFLQDNQVNYLNGSIYYEYKEYDRSEVDTWIINYIDNYQYKIYNAYSKLENEEIKQFSNNITECLNHFENLLNIQFDIYEDETKVEKEFIIHDNGYEKLYLLDMYIPFKLEKSYTRESFTILVPVKTVLGYEKDSEIYINFTTNITKTINKNEFMNSNNVLNMNILYREEE